jgi:RNA ligase (TIGR02306 family)
LPGIKGGRRFQLEQYGFTKYTDIQHYWRYPNVFEGDEDVVVTEKIHSTNSRVGVLFESGEWVYAAGSHKVRWEEAKETERYWKPLRTAGMLSMLAELCGECADVIVYGEIFGSSVQDLDYGFEGDEGYRVFDIKVNGVFLDWADVQAHCLKHDVLTVPVLYRGPWVCVGQVLDEYASGLTSVGTPKRKFKGREGIVIKPTLERQTNMIGGRFNAQRAILKHVSADYLDRKGAQDNA